MIRRTWFAIALSLAGSATFAGEALAQHAAPTGPSLALRHVRLYEAGVAYFERSGKVTPGSDIALSVPASHLDDALKTLVVLSRDGSASVSGLELPSRLSQAMGRALAGLPEGGAALSHAALLRSLEGASVLVRTERESLRGKLIEVLEGGADEQICTPSAPSNSKPPAAPLVTCRTPLTLLLLSDKAEIRRLSSHEVISVQPTDGVLSERMKKGLEAAAAGSARSSEKLSITAKGSGEITLGYVAETPVWRSTYRMVLGQDDKATLQAWALFHNDTDEAWSKVRVELVNGQPTSFLFPMTAPRYARRELRTPSEDLSTVPQLMGKTVDDQFGGGVWGDQIGDSFGAGGLGLSGVGEGGGGRGEGIGLGSIGTVGHGAGPGSSTALSVGSLAAIAPAQGTEAGALFRYALPEPIDLAAHSSALVPFSNQAVSAQRIAYFSTANTEAESAVRFKNNTAQTLPAGPIALYEDGGFAGEAQIERMKPEEVRTLRFGLDLDVKLQEKSRSHTDSPKLLVVERGVLTEHFVRSHEVSLGIDNRSGSGRKVMLGLDYVDNSKVTGTDALDFDVASGRALAVFDVAPRSQTDKAMHVEEGLARGFGLAALTSSQLRDLASAQSLPEKQRKVVTRAAESLKESEVFATLIPKRNAEIARQETDLIRLRAHLSAMSKDSDAAEDVGARLLEGEDRIKAIRKRVAQLEMLTRRWAQTAQDQLQALGPMSGQAR